MKNNENPLLQTSNLDFLAIPFNLIKNDHFRSAIDEVIRSVLNTIKTIGGDSQKPTFENTIERLETCTEDMEFVSGVLSNLFNADTDKEKQVLVKEINPKLADVSNDIYLNANLFLRVKTVYQERINLEKEPERKMLLERTYKEFVRNGALLNPADKDKLRSIDRDLSKLGPDFSENVLNSTNAFQYLIEDSNALKGLPDSAIEAAKQDAKDAGKDGWLFTLQQPSYLAFMKYSEDRTAREKIWRAMASRAYDDKQFDNSEILKKMASLRHERALLLGYKSHAHFVLEERMARNSVTVYAFLKRLLEHGRKAVDSEMTELAEFATSQGLSGELKPWDYAYYSRKLKEKKFDLDLEKTRPYFRLENVINGIFEHARRLYGLTFKERKDLPVYHPDVKVFEVNDETSGEYVALFYCDFFPRPSKKNGAWMTTYLQQGLFHGEIIRPHVSIVCNFTKPTESTPSLLTYDEIETLFHEFGHALHAMVSNCRYRSLASPNVYWDFVELPSHIMENWVKEKESLDLFASHYLTGEKIPADYVRKIRDGSRFHAGYMMVRQIQFALLDMAWHAHDPRNVTDVVDYERKAVRNCEVFAPEDGTCHSCSFSHIFSGAYSSGYYSYKWAEVLAADAFELFLEKGIFSREVADAFRENVLSKGGSEHPMELFKRFRGREPDPDALLRQTGLL